MSITSAAHNTIYPTQGIKALRHEISTKSRSLRELFAVPNSTELQACWELCRLQNGMGCATVFLPVAWSIAMVYRAQSDVTGLEAITRAVTYFFMCIGIKCLIMTIDDVLDYDIDAKVERTKKRAIPRGAITIERAWLFFALQVIIGVALAFTMLSHEALLISMTVWPLYVIYPTCKRWMSFAPIPLGLMFNIGIFMGWADLTTDGSIPYATLVPMYIGATLWTVTYETAYQHQDRLEDIEIGMKSLAIFLGKSTLPVCAATATGFGACMALGGYLNGQGLAFFTSIAYATYILLANLRNVDIDSPKSCMQYFLLTPKVGNAVLMGLVVDAVVQRVVSGVPLLF
ncbi:UbiA-domain-containing protein [Cylindrobasidium torrendii FP15055 ss-10]|uniref:UbiA-domain-containing protein n=1 Tax=Cylindrobasidium torrendii FP15055 ss-10 TaxID=1314674 RepID=A0A0D7B615_9AGAR|nr:UbiA-domain-containing protein [Cylindrobasidium torrendii FP15055 ss-10]